MKQMKAYGFFDIDGSLVFWVEEEHFESVKNMMQFQYKEDVQHIMTPGWYSIEMTNGKYELLEKNPCHYAKSIGWGVLA